MKSASHQQDLLKTSNSSARSRPKNQIDTRSKKSKQTRQQSTSSHHRQLYNMHLVLEMEAQKRRDDARKDQEVKFKEECTFKPDLSLTKSKLGDRSHLTFQRATPATYRATSK